MIPYFAYTSNLAAKSNFYCFNKYCYRLENLVDVLEKKVVNNKKFNKLNNEVNKLDQKILYSTTLILCEYKSTQIIRICRKKLKVTIKKHTNVRKVFLIQKLLELRTRCYWFIHKVLKHKILRSIYIFLLIIINLRQR